MQYVPTIQHVPFLSALQVVCNLSSLPTFGLFTSQFFPPLCCVLCILLQGPFSDSTSRRGPPFLLSAVQQGHRTLAAASSTEKRKPRRTAIPRLVVSEKRSRYIISLHFFLLFCMEEPLSGQNIYFVSCSKFPRLPQREIFARLGNYFVISNFHLLANPTFSFLYVWLRHAFLLLLLHGVLLGLQLQTLLKLYDIEDCLNFQVCRWVGGESWEEVDMESSQRQLYSWRRHVAPNSR